MSPEEERGEREEKKMPFIVATYVYASSQGQRTHSARTNISQNQIKKNANYIRLTWNTQSDIFSVE